MSSKDSTEKIPLKQTQNRTNFTEPATELPPTNSEQEPLSNDLSDSDACYRKWAIAIAWVSVFLLIVLGTASFILAARTGSSALFGFGFDAILDVGTSVVVIWRFYGSQDTIYSRNRENAANMFLAALFLIGAFCVAAKATVYLVEGTLLTVTTWLYIVACFACFSTVLLSLVKFYLGYKLNSMSVISDGYSSLACGITALGIVVSAVVYDNNPSVHYLDNVVAIGVALFLLVYGIKLLIMTLMDPVVSSKVTSCCKKIIRKDQELIER